MDHLGASQRTWPRMHSALVCTLAVVFTTVCPRKVSAFAASGFHGPSTRPQPPVGTIRGQNRARTCASRQLKCATTAVSGNGGVERLNAWLKERDSLSVQSCKVAPVRWGLGLRARRDIAVGEVIIDVPGSGIISEAAWSEGMDAEAALRVQSVLYDAWGWGGGGGGGLEVGDILLAVRLLHERSLDKASSWAPYVAALPDDLSDSPLQWDEASVSSLLHGVMMAGDALALKRSIDVSFSLLDSVCFQAMPLAFPPNVFSAQAFRWAVGSIISRAIPSSAIPGLSPALGLLLVPGLDFANHDDTVRVQFAAGARGGVALVADRHYAAGQEVLTSYGPKSNAQMVMSMGFTRPDPLHPFNSADIQLAVRDLCGDGELCQRKTAVLQHAALAPIMRFRVPAAEHLLRRGLNRRGPSKAPSAQAGACGYGDGDGVVQAPEVAGEDQIEDSWALVVPFLRLCLLGVDDLQRLGLSLGAWGQGGGGESGGGGRDSERSGDLNADVWERMWQPLDAELEKKVKEHLLDHLGSVLSEIETSASSPQTALDKGAVVEAKPSDARVAEEGHEDEGERRARQRDLAAIVREGEAGALREAIRFLASLP